MNTSGLGVVRLRRGVATAVAALYSVSVALQGKYGKGARGVDGVGQTQTGARTSDNLE